MPHFYGELLHTCESPGVPSRFEVRTLQIRKSSWLFERVRADAASAHCTSGFHRNSVKLDHRSRDTRSQDFFRLGVPWGRHRSEAVESYHRLRRRLRPLPPPQYRTPVGYEFRGSLIDSDFGCDSCVEYISYDNLSLLCRLRRSSSSHY